MSIFFNNVAKAACDLIPVLVASEVVFGAPSRTCSGNGICKVYSIHAAARLNIPCERVRVRLTVNATHLLLFIPVENCSQQLIEKQFSGTHFMMEEDFPLPRNLTKTRSKQCAFVRAGSYSYVHRHGFFGMKLPLVTD